MDFLSLRRHTGRTLLVGLSVMVCLFLVINQSDLTTPVRPGTRADLPPLYPSRRIHDYQSLYTAQEETAESVPLSSHKFIRFHFDSDENVSHGVEGEARENATLEEKEKQNTGPEEDTGSRNLASSYSRANVGINDHADPSAGLAKDGSPDAGLMKAGGPGANKVKNTGNGVGLSKDSSLDVGQVESIGPRASTYDEPGAGTSQNETNLNPGGQAEIVPGLRQQLLTEAATSYTEENLIEVILTRERELLTQAMEGYKFHPKLKAKNMNDLAMESGGRPVRSLVITTWRSGSTFIGDILESHPANFYHYEPLLDFGISQVRYGKDAKQAIHNLQHLLTCNYTDMEHYLAFGPDHPWLFSHNERLWNYCSSFPELCWQPDFLAPFCRLFPFQSVKTVRLRLNLTKELLEDKTLGVQVLLLVRDPRGTMQSRHHRDWCPGNPDCDEPARLCNDLVSDYNTAQIFKRKFPHSFRVVRYEDLSFQAHNKTKELFDFFHLNYHPLVQMFLDTHTKKKIGGTSSTFRDSKTAPIHWQQDLPWEEVKSIQRVCRRALKVWGYEIAKDEKHLRSFKPVGRLRQL